MYEDILSKCKECEELDKFLKKEYGTRRILKFGDTNVEATIKIIETLSKNVISEKSEKNDLINEMKKLSDYLGSSFPKVRGDNDVETAIGIMEYFRIQQQANKSSTKTSGLSTKNISQGVKNP